MRCVIEVKPVRHLFRREFPVHHQVFDFHHGELSDPITWGASAHLGRYLVQMLRGHTEFPCVESHITVCPVGSRLEHADEARHDVGSPLRHFFVLKESGMGVHREKLEYDDLARLAKAQGKTIDEIRRTELVPFKANNLVVQSTSQLPVIVANVEYDMLTRMAESIEQK